MKSKKAITTLVLAFISAFILLELLLMMIGIPTYGVQSYINGLDIRNWDKCRIYKPYSKYFIIEGDKKGKIASRNNYGFPGLDIDIHKKNAIVLGSSFIEAIQVTPAEISTSIANQYFAQDHSNYQVINLGFRGSNPHIEYFRGLYWSRLLNPEIVVLVIDHFPFQEMQANISWECSDNFGEVDKQFTHTLYREIRNNSRIINSIFPLLQKTNDNTKKEKKKDTKFTTNIIKNNDLLILQQCLTNYKKAFGHKLIVLNIAEDCYTDSNKSFRHFLKQNCIEKGISFYDYPNIKKPANRFNNGGGHLNEKGNRDLGVLLYAIIQNTIQNQKPSIKE